MQPCPSFSCPKAWTEDVDADLRAVTERYDLDVRGAVAGGAGAEMEIDGDESWMTEHTQKALAFRTAQCTFDFLWRDSDAAGRANLQAQCETGIGAWLQPAPSVDTSLSEVQFATAVAYRLGVDQEPSDPRPCRFCSAARDVRGLRDLSCTAGGDVAQRHNQVRDLVYDLARRARTNPRMEQQGLLTEPGFFSGFASPSRCFGAPRAHSRRGRGDGLCR